MSGTDDDKTLAEGTVVEKKPEKAEISKASAKPEKAEKTEGNEKAKKARKPPKTLPAKKLPGLLKKSYTKEKLDKRILKRIYIAGDRALVEKLFEPDPKTEGAKKPKYKIPPTTQIPQKDVKRLKLVAKQIKRQRGRFKLAPFIAVVCLVAAIGVAVTFFKNPLAKYGIKTAMESIFVARCDIARVNIEFFNSRIEVAGIAQADGNDPMKNLFEIGRIEVAFNLTELLRGRFDAQTLAAEGIVLGTERTVSGELPPKKAKEIKDKKVKEAKKNDSAGFFDSLGAKSNVAAKSAMDQFLAAVNQYNPETVLKEVESSLASPAVVAEVKETATKLMAAYAEKPAEIDKQIAVFTETAQRLTSLDVSQIRDVESARSAVQTVTDAIEDGKKAKAYVDGAVQGLEADLATARGLGDKLKNAINTDYTLARSKIDMYTSITLDDGTKLIGDVIDTYLYGVLGKYYPYLQKAIEYAGSMKTAAKVPKDKTEKKTAKASRARLPGRDIYWRDDTVPSFLIENLKASGSVGVNFTAKATNISNDMDKRGAPIKATFALETEGGQEHGGALTVDARSTSSAPLIEANYSGRGFPLALDFAGSGVGSALAAGEVPDAGDAGAALAAGTGAGNASGNTVGVPKVSGIAAITGSLSASENYAFGIDAAILLNPVTLSAAPFEPALVSSLYQRALAGITELSLGVRSQFAPGSGLNLAVDTNADKVVLAALNKGVSEELDALKADAMVALKAKLEASGTDATGLLGNFEETAKLITDRQKLVEELNNAITKKKTELEDKIKNAATEKANAVKAEAAQKVDAAKKETETQVKNTVDAATSGLRDQAKDAASGAVNNLLNRFKQ